jgi:hypothetical protein
VQGWRPRQRIPSKRSSNLALSVAAMAELHRPSYRVSVMQGLFEAVRAACPSGIWSKAVELVRVFAVTQLSADGAEIVCRVRLLDRAIPATVQLYPEDAEWDCDCPSKAPCCEHVAAAVIAIRKAQTEGKALPQAMSSTANLGYRFGRYQGELKLDRLVLRADGTKVPLKVSLASVVADHATGLDLAPAQEDLQVDRLIGNHGMVRPDQVLAVLKLLAGHKNLEFDGKSIQILNEPLRPRAVISAVGTDFLVQLAPDPAVKEIVASFVALTEVGLAPLAATVPATWQRWSASCYQSSGAGSRSICAPIDCPK